MNSWAMQYNGVLTKTMFRKLILFLNKHGTINESVLKCY